MRMFKIKKMNKGLVVGIITLGLASMAALTFLIEWAWNHFVPAYTNWNEINHWQAFGLLILLQILIGSVRSGTKVVKG